MAVDQELIAEIEQQLNDDILHFGWLCQIARSQNPNRSQAECVQPVLDAVVHLHQKNTIVVGNAEQVRGIVEIQPWRESGDELRAKLEWAIAHSNSRDRGFCFWIQLARHIAA